MKTRGVRSKKLSVGACRRLVSRCKPTRACRMHDAGADSAGLPNCNPAQMSASTLCKRQGRFKGLHRSLGVKHASDMSLPTQAIEACAPAMASSSCTNSGGSPGGSCKRHCSGGPETGACALVLSGTVQSTPTLRMGGASLGLDAGCCAL